MCLMVLTSFRLPLDTSPQVVLSITKLQLDPESGVPPPIEHPAVSPGLLRHQ